MVLSYSFDFINRHCVFANRTVRIKQKRRHLEDGNSSYPASNGRVIEESCLDVNVDFCKKTGCKVFGGGRNKDPFSN